MCFSSPNDIQCVFLKAYVENIKNYINFRSKIQFIPSNKMVGRKVFKMPQTPNEHISTFLISDRKLSVPT